MLKFCDIEYCYGVSDEVTFEYDWTALTDKPSNLYDMTVDSPPLKAGMVFHKEGLSGDKLEATDNFLNHIIQNNDTDKQILLKIDIEGWEYDWIRKTDIKEVAKNVPCLIIEFHNIHVEPFRGSIEKIQEYYNIVWLHGNNFSPVVDGLPTTPEICFIRKDYPVLHSFKGVIPLEVDKPNDINKPDIIIDYDLTTS
jgi:FkbM family methyltransferase